MYLKSRDQAYKWRKLLLVFFQLAVLCQRHSGPHLTERCVVAPLRLSSALMAAARLPYFWIVGGYYSTLFSSHPRHPVGQQDLYGMYSLS